MNHASGGMVTRFETAVEATLHELSIDLTYPQDAVAERFFGDSAQPPRIEPESTAGASPTRASREASVAARQ
jgi:hypothetical protein